MYPVFFTLMLVMVFSAGCINNNSPSAQTANPSPTGPIVTPTLRPDAVTLYDRGFDEYISGNYSTALDLYSAALVSERNFTQAWIGKGDALVRLNRSSEAVLAYDAAIAIHSEIPEIWNSRGEALMNAGRYQEARDSFDAALRIAPIYKKALDNRNRTFVNLTGVNVTGVNQTGVNGTGANLTRANLTAGKPVVNRT